MNCTWRISQLDEKAVRRVTAQKDIVIERLNTQLVSKNEDITKLKTDYNTLWEKYKILVLQWDDMTKQPEIIEAVKRVEERKEQKLPLKDFSRAWIGMVVVTIGENVSHTGQNSLLLMRLFIPNPTFRTSFRSLITCRAAQIHTLHLAAPMDVLTNLRIGTEHRKLDWEHHQRRRHNVYPDNDNLR